MKKIVIILMVLFSVSCSINKFAMAKVADALTSAGDSTVFIGDDDPQLIGDSLPFVLKMYESLLETLDDNEKLYFATGSSYVMYANAFVHTPAEMLSSMEFEKQEDEFKRAKKLYLRGRLYLLTGLDLKYKGIKEALLKGTDLEPYLSKMDKKDVPYLYWTAASWFAAFSVDPFDFELSLSSSRAIKLMEKALELDPDFDNGSIHEFFVAYYGALPAEMGGSDEKARQHFDEAVKLSEGKKISPYLALASSVCVKNQDYKEFKSLLTVSLAIDIDKYAQYRLVNTIHKKKVIFLLENADNYFLIEEGEF